MNRVLQLEEVIWEINARCNKNCAYCGFKNVIGPDKELTDSGLLQIADQIAQAKVNEVTLSGGEPGLLSPVQLGRVIAALGAHEKIKIKAVTNGTLISRHSRETLLEFERIGLSVNTTDDAERMEELLKMAPVNRVTVITNFGKHNWFDFDEVRDAYLAHREKYGLLWQVQLTTGNDFLLPRSGIAELWERLENIHGVVLSDCLQAEHECTAGWRSCGITWNGGVVACLAERTYVAPDKLKVYDWLVGLHAKPLTEIWQTEFRDIRFDGTRKCCRDCIKYPCKPSKSKLVIPPVQMPPMEELAPPWVKPPGGDSPIIAMYAVVSPPDQSVFRYGVTGGRSTTGD